MPDFICIGGQRTGTTWLHHVLSANDTVWMPPCKELHHFDTVSGGVEVHPYRYREHLASRLKHYGLAAARRVGGSRIRPDVRVRTDWDWDLRYFLRPGRSDAWYRSLFEVRGARGRVTGEITPAYSILPPADIARIARAFGDTRVILILRDPVARAWSHAQKDLARDDIARPERAIAFLRSENCAARSNWPVIWRNWSAHWPEDRILVLDFAEIGGEPERIVSRIGDFIGAPLSLPGSVGGSLRERGSSTFKAGGIPEGIRAAVADIYEPIIEQSAELFPEIAAGWRH